MPACVNAERFVWWWGQDILFCLHFHGFIEMLFDVTSSENTTDLAVPQVSCPKKHKKQQKLDPLYLQFPIVLNEMGWQDWLISADSWTLCSTSLPWSKSPKRNWSSDFIPRVPPQSDPRLCVLIINICGSHSTTAGQTSTDNQVLHPRT